MGNPILQPFGSRGALGTLLQWENLAENTGVNRAHGFTKSVKSAMDKTKHLKIFVEESVKPVMEA